MARLRIILVDDDADVRAVVGASLRPEYEVVEAMDGLDALNKLENYEPDFAIIDSVMPLMDGFELCEAIRKHDRFNAMPVIFLSAHSRKDQIKRGYASGANLYLTKPIDPSRIIKNIEFTVEHEKVEPRTKRYSLDRLKELEAEEQRRTERNRAEQKLADEQRAEQRRAEQKRRAQPSPPPEPEPEPTPPPEPKPPPEDRVGTEAEQKPGRGKMIGGEEVELQAGDRAEPEAHDFTAGPRPRVMIVENEDDARNIMDIALRKRFEVTTARDGLEAIQNIVQYEPDLLILDIMMPKMNGYQLLQTLRRNPSYKDLPIIVVSAKSTRRDRDYVARLGATAFIPKPFTTNELQTTVDAIASAPIFKVKPKKVSIEEIVEREFLRVKDKVDKESQEDRKHKFAEMSELLHEEPRGRRHGH